MNIFVPQPDLIQDALKREEAVRLLEDAIDRQDQSSLTQAQQVWQTIRDHNATGISTKTVAELTGLPKSNCSALVSMMLKRNMIYGLVAHRADSKREVRYYFTTDDEYVLKPLPGEDGGHGYKGPVPTIAEMSAFIDKLTVAEAKHLMGLLNSMFGDKQ